ncbi:MAG: hypothetical protein HY761_10040 [Candidatus Omnitrophica bacterium]|nr:hypothetical protein [Candidatus Omnitrophota bacterium]
MPVFGGEAVAKNIKSFGGGFLKHVNKTMEIVRERLDDRVTRNMSLRDHNLPYLRKIGHPYAARHGGQGMSIHDPYWLVHTQGGRLLASKSSGVIEASVTGSTLKAGAFVKLDESQAKYALYLIYGTSKMIPRDFMTGSLMQEKNKLQDYLQQNLKDMVFNFKPVA